MGKFKVESFNLDHTTVKAPFVRLAARKEGPGGDVVTKFDIRFTQPNADFLSTSEVHTLEHLAAEMLRDELPQIIDFSPMGCRTGFYLTLFGDADEASVAPRMLAVFRKVAAWDESRPIPGSRPEECGNYRDHDVPGAKKRAAAWVNIIEKEGFECHR
ncbi:MAG: S-ribosylhomocysteine lyase [Spirochaetaceae bacterium]|jgi:S-ribosylhomocysteine lyase|nr:S-ribosylhomocysteine lyase [Spirochaetaceae bacterium]